MASTDTVTRFTLRLPADPAYLGTVRLFASAIARHFEAGEEALEDLKIAVTEAASAFLRYEDEAAGTVDVLVAATNGGLAVEITSPDLTLQIADHGVDDPTPTPRGLAAELGLDLINSLFPDSTVTVGPTAAISFTVPLA